MIKANILEQLKEHFNDLSVHIELRYRETEHEKLGELLEMLNSIASVSNFIAVKKDSVKSDIPQFTIVIDNIESGIEFKGIPGGHEFTSLIMAILHGSKKGKWPDEVLQKRIARIKGPINVRTYISLSCTNCPDVVQTLNQISLIHGDFKHTMIDGDFVPHEVKTLGIQGVPAVFAGDKMIHSGKSNLMELIQSLEKNFGIDSFETEQKEYSPVDVAIIGGGPAGCSAAIYSARKGLKTAIIAGKIGGQVNDTAAISNLISVPLTSGKELSSNLRKHSEEYDMEIFENRTISKLIPGDLQLIKTDEGETFSAKQVIVATGASWRKLSIRGESEYIGRGVAFCPHCDGPFFKGQNVAVVGGGNSGVEAAIDLAGICTSVTLLEFLDELKADQVLVDRLKSLDNVNILLGVATKEIHGDGQKVSSLEYEYRENGKTEKIDLQGVFVQIGLKPNSSMVSEVLETNKFGEIEVDRQGRTSVKGIYAAGDVTTTKYKQIVVALGEGAKASLSAFEDSLRQL